MKTNAQIWEAQDTETLVIRMQIQDYKYICPMIRVTITNLVLSVLLIVFIVLTVNGWIKVGRYKHSNKRLIEEVETLRDKLEKSTYEAEILLSEIKVLEERRIMLDSLHKTNKQHRNDEKIKLIQSASDSTIKRIVLDHIRAK